MAAFACYGSVCLVTMYLVWWSIHTAGIRLCLTNIVCLGVNREMLRWTLFTMQTTGHLLLGSSFYIEQMLDEEEQAEKGLALPKSSRIKKLQCALMGKMAQ